jgi:predicted Zn-dependent peptidase
MSDFTFVKPQKHYLRNSIPVYIVSASSQPIINIQLLFDAGKWHEQTKGIANFVGRMIQEGTMQHTAKYISNFFDNIGAYLNITTGVDQTQLSIYCLAKHFSGIIGFVRDFITIASFPDQELDLVKKSTLQNLLINRKKTNYEATTLTRELIYGADHPYGYSQNEQLIAHCESHQLRGFYNRLIKEQKCEIILAGDVTDVHLKLLDEYIGSINLNTEKPYQITHLHPVFEPLRLTIEKPNLVQTSIRVAKPLFVKKHQDQVQFEVLNEAIGGYFGSRLMKNLREKNGFTYGVYSSMTQMRHFGFWSVGADVNKQQATEALKQVRYEIQLICDERISESELDLVKNYMCGSYLKSINTPIAIADMYRNLRYHGLPEDYYDHYISRIKEVTAEQLQDLANKYLSGDFLEILVG